MMIHVSSAWNSGGSKRRRSEKNPLLPVLKEKQQPRQSGMTTTTAPATRRFDTGVHDEQEKRGHNIFLTRSKKAYFHRRTTTKAIQDMEVCCLLRVQGKMGAKSQHETLIHHTPIQEEFYFYENKDKKNRLMRIDELHKFSDGTLDDVRTALNDRLKGIRMEYLPQTFLSQRDKANARAMIQAIDKS
ncbi:hypothetical protein Tco_0083508 [Tanacetum coccineum]